MDKSLVNNAIVTIITPDHIKFALALYQSLKRHTRVPFNFYVFLASDDKIETIYSGIKFDLNEVKLLTPFEINTAFSREIYDSYYQQSKDCYRWSMKPVVINYLLEEKGYQKVIYADSDLYFYESIQFIFEQLDHERVLLSPHWRCSKEPRKDWFNFTHNFMHGIYNGGFIAVNHQAKEVMLYWANLCHHACEQNASLGLHDDQKYLDIFQSVFEGIGVIRHKGCNVSNWNQIECARTIDAQGRVTINEIYPIVFIHFTAGTITEIVKGHDLLLSSFFKEYADHLRIIDKTYDLEKVADYLLQQEALRFAADNNVSAPNELFKILNKYFRRVKSLLQ
jgi:hypothetical protein